MQKHKLSKLSRLKSVFGGSIGNLVEWYDWYVYSAFSLYFAGVFFPKDSETAQLLNAAGIFAIGFLMRPVGGWLMGAYADRKGRKAALTLSVLMMCGGSLLITIVPGYDTIGIAAPIILVIARMIQGLSIGGEYGTAATYLSEMAPPKYRGLYSSFHYVTTIMGQLIALLILLSLQRYFLSTEQLSSWGWRIPFGIGAILAISAMYLRRNISETENFKNETVAIAKRGSFKELLKFKRETAIIIGFTIGTTVPFYTFTTYMQKFMVNTAGFSKDDSTLISIMALSAFIIAQPLGGLLSDAIGRKRVMLIFGLLGVTTTYPILILLGTNHQIWMAALLIIVALCILSLCTSISAILKAELFPANIRSLGVSLPYALTVAIFGGTAEYIALLFKNWGHANWFYLYVTACIGISLFTTLNMRDTEKHSRMEEE